MEPIFLQLGVQLELAICVPFSFKNRNKKPGRARFLCEIDYSSCFNRREYPFPYCTHRDTRLRVAEEMSDWAMT